PSNRERLMALEPGAFIAIMRAWREPFVAGAELPLIGTSADDLRRIEAPACIIPGDDLTHPSATGIAAARLMRDCEVHRVTDANQNVDVTPVEDWYARAGDMGAIFADFLKRKLDVKAPAAGAWLACRLFASFRWSRHESPLPAGERSRAKRAVEGSSLSEDRPPHPTPLPLRGEGADRACCCSGNYFACS